MTLYRCPNNGKPVTCRVCQKTIPHRVEALSDRVPSCPECHILMKPEAQHGS
jgi:hypothetical protein